MVQNRWKCFASCVYPRVYDVCLFFTILLNQGSWGSNARTTNVMSSNPDQVEMYLNTTLCDKVCQLFAAGRWFSPGPSVSSTNTIDHHDIAEILLKVALKTIKITLIFKCRFASFIPMIFTIHVTCDSCWYPVLCTENLFLFVEFQFSWFSLFPSNHEI